LTENVLKAKLLSTTENIYSKLRIDQMKVVNIGNGGKDGHPDIAG